MTLIIAWRDSESNINLFSDSRVNMGAVSVDFGIKVARIRYNIYEPTDHCNGHGLLSSGELGITFAGTTVLPLMVKEALSEILDRMQVVPDYYGYDMDAIAEFVFKVFRLIAADVDFATMSKVDACMIFSGYCTTHKEYRAFLMDITPESPPSMREILTSCSDIEIAGTGKTAATALLSSPITRNHILYVLQCVIDDDDVQSVGGNIQFGSFRGSKFQPCGVAKTHAGDVHYWRGPLDLNASPFEPGAGLTPNFPYLDLD